MHKKLLWIVLMGVSHNLWAAAASDGYARELGMDGSGGLSRPMVSTSRVTDDEAVTETKYSYKPATLEEAVEFCASIARDNIIWITGLQAYWSDPKNVEAGDLAKGVGFKAFLKQSELDQKEWRKFSRSLEDVLYHKDNLPYALNQLMQLRMQTKISLVEMEEISTALESIFYGKKENTQAQLQAFDTLFNTLLPFSNEDYQSYYRNIGYALRPQSDRKAKDTSSPYSKIDDAFFEVQNLRGEVIRLPFLEDIELKSEKDPDLYRGIVIGTIKVLTPVSCNFFLPLNYLPFDKAIEYKERFYRAREEYRAAHERKMAMEARIAARARKGKAGAAAGVPSVAENRSIDELLVALGERPAPHPAKKEKARKADASVAMKTVAVSPAVGGELTERGSAGASVSAAVDHAAEREAERKLLNLRTLELAAAMAGKSVPILERTYASARTGLTEANKDMLQDLVLRAVPARVYDWDNLVALLGNLGFMREGTNFRSYDNTGKRKQIGLHYLHRDKALNPVLMQIMFKQLSAIGLGRVHLGTLLGLTLEPWPWESTGHA